MEHSNMHHDHQHDDKQKPLKESKEDAHHKMDHNAPMGQPGHDHHAMMINDFKKRFWISLIAAVQFHQ